MVQSKNCISLQGRDVKFKLPVAFFRNTHRTLNAKHSGVSSHSFFAVFLICFYGLYVAIHVTTCIIYVTTNVLNIVSPLQKQHLVLLPLQLANVQFKKKYKEKQSNLYTKKPNKKSRCVHLISCNWIMAFFG